MKFFLPVLLLHFLIIPLFGQVNSDTLDLQSVEVVAPRLEKFGIGQNTLQFDEENLPRQSASGLDDLLAGHSSIFIKSYGAGSLASPASRGTGFGHTAVLWNGFNLQSPLNGGIDFSLLPLEMIDEVKVQPGGSAALFGSGAIGGTIHLDQRKTVKPGWHGAGGLEGGSFGRFGQRMALSLGKPRWSSDLRINHDQATNDFPIPDDRQNKRQENARLEQWALTQHNRLELANKQILHTWIWLQATDRQIPPSLTQSNVHAIQRDTSIRLAAEWQKYGLRTIQKIRTAWLDERFEYSSDLEAPTFTRSKSLISEIENDWSIHPSMHLLTGLNYTHERGIAPQVFAREVFRHRVAAFVSFKHQLASWHYGLNLRQEWVSQNRSPISGSLGLQSPHWKGLAIKSQFSRNYKLPAFNDLYWRGTLASGNPELKAEKSWNQELSLIWQMPLKKISWKQQVNVFNLWVNDWILWIPQNNGLWQPDNLRRVWSRGVEVSSVLEWKKGDWGIDADLTYQWNRATNERVYAGATEALGKQLIHVPLHLARGHFQVNYKNSELLFRHQYNGNRFTSSDNKETVGAYHRSDLVLLQRFLLGKKVLQVQFRIENIWNANYEVLRFRPMPGRGFWGGIKMEF